MMLSISRSSNTTYTVDTETVSVLATKSFLTNNPVRKVNDFSNDISNGTITVKDIELLRKII